MTVQPMGPGTQVAVPQADFNTGLDDMTQADLSIPRLTIVNKKGMFRDSLSNTELQAMNVIILGLVKQRTLWPAQVPQGTQSQPMCRSNDFAQGFVNLKQTVSPFPYDKAELTQAHVQPRDDGQLVFNCADCKLKEWDTHPLGGKPYCNEVWSLPLLMDPFNTGQYLPAVLNLSKTNVTPAKHYLGGFKAAETAAFTALTTISLQLLKRGDNEYSNITFQRAGATDSANWAEWSGLYLEMRNFLAREPRVFEDKPAGPPQPATPQPMAAQPMAAPQPAPVAQPAAAQTIVVQPEPTPAPAPVVQPAPMAADPNARVDPWSQPGVTVDPAPVQPSLPMQAPAAVAQEPAPQATVPAPAPAPAPVAQPAPEPPAAVAPAPVTPPAPAAVPAPAPAPTPAPAAVAAPTPQPAVSQAAPAPAPTVSAPVPTSPAVPAASVPVAPGADDDDLPF